MDSKGRLHYTKADGTEFVGDTFEETGVHKPVEKPQGENRASRRAEASDQRRMQKLLTAELAKLVKEPEAK